MKILCIDDGEDERKILGKLLFRFGDCVMAGDGFNAISLFTKSLNTNELFDLICLDVNMPVLNGIDTLKAIRTHEKIKKVKRTKIIMISAMEEDVNCWGLRKDFMYDAYIQKPLGVKKIEVELRHLGLRFVLGD